MAFLLNGSGALEKLIMKSNYIFDAYIYVCSECHSVYGCDVPTESGKRIKKKCRLCPEKYRCVHRLVYKLGKDDQNIKPEWSGKNHEGIVLQSDGFCSEECAILRNSEVYSDDEIRSLLRKNQYSEDDIEEIILLLSVLKRMYIKPLIREETHKYLIAIFRKILKIDERLKDDPET
ncbi:MAG: hypothetical protein P4L42_06510 [Desulfocapsaceae bacterium]|nr:hypothetical protein [Desulfocapsaceae bacterium]